MRSVVARQATRIPGAVVHNGSTAVLRHDPSIEIHHSLARNASGDSAHTVCGVANRTRETVVKVVGVAAEAGVTHDLGEVVAFDAHAVGTGGTQIRIGKKIRYRSTRNRSLTEFIAPFEQMPIL